MYSQASRLSARVVGVWSLWALCCLGCNTLQCASASWCQEADRHVLEGLQGTVWNHANQDVGTYQLLDACTLQVNTSRFDNQGQGWQWWAGSSQLQHLVSWDNATVLLHLPHISTWNQIANVVARCSHCEPQLVAHMEVQAAGTVSTSAGRDKARRLQQVQPVMPSCMLQLADAVANYATCQTLTGTFATNFTFLWNTTTSTEEDVTMQTVSAALSADSDGWAAFGLPRTPGIMVGTNAFIVKACPTCTTGASVDCYLLNSQESDGITPPCQLTVLSMSAAKVGQQLLASFSFQLPSTSNGSAAVAINYAIGPLLADGTTLDYHGSDGKASGTINFADGSADVGQDVLPSNYDQIVMAHGYLMAIGIGLLLPLGAVIARNFKEHDPFWFYAHIALQVLGFLAALAGVGCAAYLRVDDQLSMVHRGIGATVIAMIGVQVFVGFFMRPSKQNSQRWVFNLFHHWWGRLAVALGISNVYTGIYLYNHGVNSEAERHYYCAYTVLLGTIIMVSLAKSAWDCSRASKQGSTKDVEVAGSAEPGKSTDAKNTSWYNGLYTNGHADVQANGHTSGNSDGAATGH